LAGGAPSAARYLYANGRAAALIKAAALVAWTVEPRPHLGLYNTPGTQRLLGRLLVLTAHVRHAANPGRLFSATYRVRIDAQCPRRCATMAKAVAEKGLDVEASHRPAVLALALTLAYVAIVAALITLRAVVAEVDFLSIGWIMLLALIPIIPWLIPALVPAAGRIAPFVQSVKLPGGVEISLNAAARPVAGLGSVESALTSDHLVHNLTATATPFTTTDATTVINGVQAVRRAGAAAVVVDLSTGSKWRLPNLYFLAWILANDPITRWLVFTETRLDTQAVFVGVCAAPDFQRAVQVAHPAYADVAERLEYADPTRQEPLNQQHLANEFNKIRAAVAPPAAGEVPTLAWVTSGELRKLLGPHLATASVRWTDQLDIAGLQTVARSPVPYVAATTADGRFRGLLEQREVVLEFTRRVLQAA
jgi:hypothetical protein